MPRPLYTLLVLASATVLAGCSGARSSSSGRAVFARFCAQCHTVTGHETNASGGDLRVGRMSVTAVASFVRVMPVHPRLDREQTQAVARYVASR